MGHASIVLALVQCLVQASPDARSVKPDVHGALVKVYCRSGDHLCTATGFCLDGPETIVTALHCVMCCDSLTVKYEASDAVHVAEVGNVLKSSDLVTLRVTDPPQSHALALAQGVPSAPRGLTALGYIGDAKRSTDFSVRVRSGASTLEDYLPAHFVKRIKQVGFPNEKNQVLPLEAALMPGTSGGPILDEDARVVGVIDGGIEGGATSVTWGIPFAQVHQLKGSTEHLPSNCTQIHELFSADVASNLGEPLLCNQARLTRVRTRVLADLVNSCDDPVAVYNVLSDLMSEAPGQVRLSGLRFDVYQIEQTGVFFTLPAGTVLVPEGEVLMGDRGRFDVVVLADRITDSRKDVALLRRFRSLTRKDPDSWQTQVLDTVSQVDSRLDRLSVERTYSVDARNGVSCIDVIGSRSDLFFAMAVTNNKYPVQPAQDDDFEKWVHLCASVMLSLSGAGTVKPE